MPQKERQQLLDQRSSQQKSLAFVRSAACVTALTIVVLLVHGFHPAAEDGGIYATGIYLRLDPSLFPHDAAFVRAPMSYSGFAWLLAGVCNLLHTTPVWALFWAHLASIALTLAAAQRICRVCGFDDGECLGAVALLAVWWTLPVAGTSLSIGDPYVTARSFSMPLSLFAISYALEEWAGPVGRPLWNRILLCLVALALTALMHELMFGFAAAFILVLRASKSQRRMVSLVAISGGALLCCLVVLGIAPAESPTFLQAELTRNYWFLAQWHWYEVCGLVAPLLVLGFSAWRSDKSRQRALCSAGFAAGVLFSLIAIVFAREHVRNHLIARLQPLRMFTVLYVLMTLILGAWLVRIVRKALPTSNSGRTRHVQIAALGVVYTVLAGVMFLVQQQNFSSSRHLETPWAHGQEPNPWIEAFSWCREHTPKDALFSLDAAYIHDARNDAQTFRAHALRSVLSDQSKDGGEAAVEPRLAETWQRGFDTQANLNKQDDEDRQARLVALGVDYIILSEQTNTVLQCAHENAVVKVCHVGRRP